MADVVFLANFASLVESQLIPDLFQEYPALHDWFEKCKKQIPNYEEVNGKGAKMFAGWFRSGLKA